MRRLCQHRLRMEGRRKRVSSIRDPFVGRAPRRRVRYGRSSTLQRVPHPRRAPWHRSSSSESVRGARYRKLRACSSRGILRKHVPTSESTMFRSKKRRVSSPTHLHAYTTIQIIRSEKFVRSSWECPLHGGYSWYPSPSVMRHCESFTRASRTHENVEGMKKAPGKKSIVSGKTARATSSRQSAKRADDLRPHYDFDYTKSRPNRFASKMVDGTVAVVLDPDVASVFRSSEAVNTLLRSVISAMPQDQRSKKRRAS